MIFKKTDVVVLIFSLFFINPEVYPKTGTRDIYRIVPSNISDGLTQRSVLNILEGTNGELWISTLDGISRFNGDRIINYRPINSSKNYIESVRISKILEGPAGDIYAATYDQGLLKYDRPGDTFSSINLSERQNKPDKITTAFYSSDGFIWVSHTNGSVTRISPRSRKEESYSLADSDRVTDFFEDQKGNVWFSTSESRVYIYHKDTNTVENFLKKNTCSRNPIEIVEIAIEDDEYLWVGTSGNGLYKITFEGMNCDSYPLPGVAEYKSENSTIHDIFHDTIQGITWVASDHGLYQISQESEAIHFHSENSNLVDNEVTAIAPGSKGVLWIGAYTGLNLAAKTNFQMFDQRTQRKLRSIVAIDGSEARKTWIASYNGLLIYDESNDVHSEILDIYPDANFGNERIMSLSVTDEEVWVGYRSTGLERYSFDENLLSRYSKNSKPAISSNAISSILRVNSGEILIGTYGGGLNLILQDGSVETPALTRGEQSNLDEKVILLFQSKNGVVWVGTESGLKRFDLQRKAFFSMGEILDESKWSADRIVLSMKEGANGDLWLGTMHDGLFRLTQENGKSEKFSAQHYPLKGPTPVSTIYAVEIDKMDNVWVSTNTGISRIDHRSNRVNHFSRSNGLIETEFDFGASHKDSNGLLYFGGSNGYNRFDPGNIEIDSPPPPVVLTSLNIAGREPRLPVALQDLELIELSHKDYFITLIFSALDFLDPSKNQYSYKLEGFDPEWITNDTRNSATYTNLPAGEYLFRVRGANSAGVWNLEGASIKIRVLPAPWMTWWALLGYVMVLLVIIYFSRRTYDSRLLAKSEAARADEMRDAADRANDELQEQLEIQDQLVNAVYRHNVDTLDLVRNFIVIQSDFFDDESMCDAMQSNQQRVLALSLLERCVFYQGDNLFADMSSYVDLLIELVLKSSPIPVERITTVNEMGNRLVPLEIASPLAIICYELLLNCVLHAFEDAGPANYIRISMDAAISDDDSGSQTLSVTVKDNGVGVPDAISSVGTDSAGLAIVNMVVNQLGGQLAISGNDGTKVVATLPDSPRLLPPYGGLQKFHP